MRAAAGKGRLLRRPLGVLDNAFGGCSGRLTKRPRAEPFSMRRRDLASVAMQHLHPSSGRSGLSTQRWQGDRGCRQGLSGDPLITPECLTQLERNIVGALSAATIKASDLTVDGGLTLLHIWRGLDEEGYERHVTNGVLQEPLGHAIYESSRLGTYVSSRECGFTFPNGIPKECWVVSRKVV